MKWIAAILMILNVTFFLQVSDREVENSYRSDDVSPDVNKESMLLLNEDQNDSGANKNRSKTVDASVMDPTSPALPDAIFDGRDVALVDTTEHNPETADLKNIEIDDTGNGQQDNNATAISPLNRYPLDINSEQAGIDITVASPVVREQDWSCYRIGPFKDPGIWQQAQQWARITDLNFTPIRSQSRELRAVRVYIGPFTSADAAQSDVEVLKTRELDHFIYTGDDNQARISLGYFTQEELADKYVKYLKSQNIPAKSQPEYRTMGPFDWMEVKIDSAVRGDLLSKDWGSESVIVAEKEC